MRCARRAEQREKEGQESRSKKRPMEPEQKISRQIETVLIAVLAIWAVIWILEAPKGKIQADKPSAVVKPATPEAPTRTNPAMKPQQRPVEWAYAQTIDGSGAVKGVQRPISLNLFERVGTAGVVRFDVEVMRVGSLWIPKLTDEEWGKMQKVYEVQSNWCVQF